jgi:hypothetical protein
MDDKERIRSLNDLFRQTGSGGQTLITPSVQALTDIDQTRLVYLVREFNDFSADNDPHGEHDFGIVKLHGESYYWKIDYYDRTLKWGSENPADPDKTMRVMTILHSHEY